MQKKLRKVTQKKMISGVAAGVAYWLGVPTWMVRVVWCCSVFFAGAGIILYLLFWIFMPKWEALPLDYEERSGG